nr:unnamed protein product [Callosobruchus analis]
MSSTDGGSTQWLKAEWIKALQSQGSAEQVDLPYFRPQTNESSKWVSQVETIKRVKWTDAQTLARIRRFLLNTAKTWFERWNPDNRTYEVLLVAPKLAEFVLRKVTTNQTVNFYGGGKPIDSTVFPLNWY